MEVSPGGRQFLDACSVVRRWIGDTAAKVVARRWGVDPATVENARKGVVSRATLEKAAAAEGWPFLIELGEALTGQSIEDFIQSELKAIADAERAREERERQLQRLRSGLHSCRPASDRRVVRLRPSNGGRRRTHRSED